MVPSPWKTVWQVLQKLKVGLPLTQQPHFQDSAQGLKGESPMFTAASFTTAKGWMQPSACSLGAEWTNKALPIHRRLFFSLKEEKHYDTSRNMDER